jgi:hypothetical protein
LSQDGFGEQLEKETQLRSSKYVGEKVARRNFFAVCQAIIVRVSNCSNIKYSFTFYWLFAKGFSFTKETQKTE